MARDTRSEFLRQLARVEPTLARAFEDAIELVRDSAQIRRITEAVRDALRTGNVVAAAEEILASISTEPSFYSALDRAVQLAMEAGATNIMATLPPARRLQVRFDGRHPDAEAWARTRAANLITEITEDHRNVIRAVLDDGIANQRRYRDIVRLLVGTRENGGLISLHSRQADAVLSARQELESMNPAVLRRTRLHGNDRGMVEARIRRGGRLTSAEVEAISQRYADRLLRLRAETIARTEANAALNAGRHLAVQQMIDRGEIRSDAVSRIWDATIDRRTRGSHVSLDGQVRAWGMPFVSPLTGASMMYPHDENAIASERINCRCTERIRIDWRTGQ